MSFITADCLLPSHILFEATCTLLRIWIGTIGTIKAFDTSVRKLSRILRLAEDVRMARRNVLPKIHSKPKTQNSKLFPPTPIR